MASKKAPTASDMAKKRWSGKTKEERSAAMRKLAKKRWGNNGKSRNN